MPVVVNFIDQMRINGMGWMNEYDCFTSVQFLPNFFEVRMTKIMIIIAVPGV